jgi:Fuc2NAc and GlcNAc transferase
VDSVNNLIILFWFLLAGVASFMLTGILRRYALSKSLLDVPNDRSSHTIPTPRGGGLAIVVTFLAGVSVLTLLEQMELPLYLSLLCAGGLVAIIGFIDDHRHIAARWRLLVHFIAAGLALYLLGGLPPLSFFGLILDLGLLGNVLAALYLVWLLNLYNFMDGIDGIAGIETVTVCLGGLALFLIAVPVTQLWQSSALLLVSVSGFLLWNFPRAKIFMGDVGSGFLGIVLGIMSIQAAWIGAELFWAWLILLGAFVTDATVTLFRRLFHGERVFEAHRSHAYQHAARKYGSHVSITLAFGIINILWLLPISLLVANGLLDGLLGVCIAYLPLVWLTFKFKAGQP